jgi:hypothetical protein
MTASVVAVIVESAEAVAVMAVVAVGKNRSSVIVGGSVMVIPLLVAVEAIESGAGPTLQVAPEEAVDDTLDCSLLEVAVAVSGFKTMA